MKNNAITYGIISGVVIILYHLGFYYWNKEVIVSPLFFYSIYLVHVPFLFYSGLKYRQTHDGLIEFREALREIVITFLVGMVIYYLMYYILFNMDSELVEMSKQRAYDQHLAWKESGQIKPVEFKKYVAAWEKNDHKVTLYRLFFGIPRRILGGFALSALVALMVKR